MISQCAIPAELKKIEELDNLQPIQLGRTLCFLHDRHRWVLPIIHWAQRNKSLPKPCTLVMFDAHEDAAPPSCMEQIQRTRRMGLSVRKLIGLCLAQKELRPDHGDWVKTGMELELIGDAVVFGIDGRARKGVNHQESLYYTDHKKVKHLFWRSLSFPGAELRNQGDLSDAARRHELSALWDGLEWAPRHGFRPVKTETRILLDIDLDCFAIEWKGYKLPWPHEIWKNEFDECTGKWFFDELVSRAGLVTIAREPGCCGGGEKSEQILHDINRFLLNGRLKLQR